MSLPFLNNQAKRREQIVAIDLGGRFTKAVHLQYKNDRYSLLGYTVMDSPPNETGLSVDVLADHLKAVARALGDRIKQVTLAVGVPDTFVRHAELPPVPVSDMRQMLKFNTKNYLQQDLPDHVFDCSVIVPTQNGRLSEAGKNPGGPASQKQKVLVGGTKKKNLEDMQAAMRQAGLQAASIVPGLLGTVNAFENAESEIFSREVVALVEVGFKNTTIVMLQNGELVMNRVVAIGGDRFTTGLSEAMGISYAEADGIKMGMPGEVQQHLEPLIMALGRELRASIDFFEHQQDVTVSQVFISGGTARCELIVQALQSELLVPCKIWNPTKALQLTLSPEQLAGIEQSAPQLTVALGAAVASF